jgi:DNA polymerase III subunit epsilon
VKLDQLAILDCETTGFDASKDVCIEIAVARYDINTASIVETYSSCIQTTAPNPVVEVNGIPEALLIKSPNADDVWVNAFNIIDQCDVIAAHNGDFDKQFVHPDIRDAKPWIDTCNDCTWPKSRKVGEGLSTLLLNHGLGVSHAHRAMADVDMLCRLFTRALEMKWDVQNMLTLALRPKAVFIADVSYKDKDLAKKAGFRWDDDKKTWSRNMFIEDAAKLGFKVRQVPA